MSEKTLFATTFGNNASGGGLYVIRGNVAERLDSVSSLGFSSDGHRVARVLNCAPEHALLGELLVYDKKGVTHYLRLDDAPDIHEAAWDGEEILVVSSWTNAVRWYGLDGVARREIRLPGPPDAWHINCVTNHAGRWYATVFGGFDTVRGWLPPNNRQRGRLIDLETRETVVDGLTSPHSPRFNGSQIFVCDSGEGSLVVFDAVTRARERTIDCEGWTRGVAFDDERIYVGVSGDRKNSGRRRAGIVTINRASWKIVDRLELPDHEVFDVALIPDALENGLRRGFATNPTRMGEDTQRSLLASIGVVDPETLWPVSEPLTAENARYIMSADFPERCAAGSLVTIPVAIENLGDAFFSSAPPYAVNITYQWRDESGTELTQARAYRSRLTRVVFPRSTTRLTCSVIVPKKVGLASLHLRLVQDVPPNQTVFHADEGISRDVIIE